MLWEVRDGDQVFVSLLGFDGGVSGCGKVVFVVTHPKEVFPVILSFCCQLPEARKLLQVLILESVIN